MSQKLAKLLRHAARTSLKSSKLKGAFEREEHMRRSRVDLGATHKEAKRAIRVVSSQYGQKPPEYARRLEHKKQFHPGLMGVLDGMWTNLGLQPV